MTLLDELDNKDKKNKIENRRLAWIYVRNRIGIFESKK